MQEYIAMWKNGFNFKDRTGRRGFWMAMLIQVIIEIVVSILSVIAQNSMTVVLILNVLLFIYAILAIIPSLAIIVRRLHDINKSGWWILISLVPAVGGIILLIFYCLKSVDDNNRFGSHKI